MLQHVLIIGVFSAVPLVLELCAGVIEKHGIVDGIYRLSGMNSNIQKLRRVNEISPSYIDSLLRELRSKPSNLHGV